MKNITTYYLSILLLISGTHNIIWSIMNSIYPVSDKVSILLFFLIAAIYAYVLSKKQIKITLIVQNKIVLYYHNKQSFRRKRK